MIGESLLAAGFRAWWDYLLFPIVVVCAAGLVLVSTAIAITTPLWATCTPPMEWACEETPAETISRLKGTPER